MEEKKMSEDWAREYAEAHNEELKEKRQKEQDAQTRRRYAEQGARAKFQEIRERVEQDLRTLRETSETFAALGVRESSDQRFVVAQATPWIDLSVELHLAMIKCECRFSSGGSAKDESKTLRICSDLGGALTVYENGGGEEFANTAEISHFILKPAIGYLRERALKN
jgi:hypothetical protein